MLHHVGLRERARDAVRETIRAEVADVALKLFDEQGFDETTVDDIAVAAGISPRSFFRYFPMKEDVVLGDPAPLGLAVRDALAGRPVAEHPWAALRACLAPVVSVTNADQDRSLRVMRVMNSVAVLRARRLEKHLAWSQLLFPLVALRVGPAGGDIAAHALIAGALGCLDVAFAEWVDRQGAASLDDLLDEAFAALRR